MLAPNQTLQNRYLIIRQLGQGGMGAVYEATDQRLRSKVAIKETFASNDEERRAFEREAHLLANLRHPTLPRVTDHFAEGDGHFLVMEYVTGEDLEKQLGHRAVPFTVEEVLPWADKILGALEHLHTRQPPILHRDIKPSNIKVTEDGDVYLLDFGLAKGRAGDMTTAQPSKSVYGYSAAYAPPEQIQGTGTDERSDIYALAATLYHLLTKIPPPESLTRMFQISLGKPDPLTPPDKLRPQVPDEISRILKQTLSLDPDRRPQRASVFRSMLNRANHQPTQSNKGEIKAESLTPTFSRQINESPNQVSQAPLQTPSPAIPSQAPTISPRQEPLKPTIVLPHIPKQPKAPKYAYILALVLGSFLTYPLFFASLLIYENTHDGVLIETDNHDFTMFFTFFFIAILSSVILGILFGLKWPRVKWRWGLWLSAIPFLCGTILAFWVTYLRYYEEITASQYSAMVKAGIIYFMPCLLPLTSSSSAATFSARRSHKKLNHHEQT